MNFPKYCLAGALTLSATALFVSAGTDKVLFPAGFETDFTRYQVVDRHDRKRARFMYMNAAAWDAAVAGASLPDGSVIVMEDHKVRMVDEETIVLDSSGGLIPTDETTNVFVMEKRAGWGGEYADDVRNGEWEYAWFSPDGVRSDRPMDGCFECHKAQEAEDFTFTTFQAVMERN